MILPHLQVYLKFWVGYNYKWGKGGGGFTFILERQDAAETSLAGSDLRHTALPNLATSDRALTLTDAHCFAHILDHVACR